MYDTYLFRDNHKLLKWAQEHTCVSEQAKKCVGWNGEMKYAHLANNLILLYQLANTANGFEVCKLHMLLWSEQKALRKDVFKVCKFFKPKGEEIWHSAIEFDGRADIPFLAVNAWTEGDFEKYSNGGCFEMAFSGIGCTLECMNDKGTIRFYEGNPLEMRRKEENDPTIDHADMFMTELRALNSWHDDETEIAGAEFIGIVEDCQTETICGEKCCIISLWSGPMSQPQSFPWTLLVAANRIEGRYIPRVGDMIHGNAFMFGTFFGEEMSKPTVECERFVPAPKESDEDPEVQESTLDSNAGQETANDENGAPEEDADAKSSKLKNGWEWLPRRPAEYPVFKSHGGGLAKSVARSLPKYVAYNDYQNKIKGELNTESQGVEAHFRLD